MYRRKTLTGSPDPTHANGTDKPCTGKVDRDVLAELLVSGLEQFEDGCELLSDDVSDEELSVPLVLVLSVLELPDGELGKDTEDSLVVVSDTGCELAG